MERLGLGGGCHWCTEGVFSVLGGVSKVEQGWIASLPPEDSYSEAVLIDYDAESIDLRTLIEIHLNTHSSTVNHSMREKYRSAIYALSEKQAERCRAILQDLQSGFKERLVTLVLPFREFKLNTDEYLGYYQKNKEKPFCKTYIEPKIRMLLQDYNKNINPETLLSRDELSL